MSEKEILRKSHERTTSHTHMKRANRTQFSETNFTYDICCDIYFMISTVYLCVCVTVCARCMLFFIAAAPFVAFVIHLFCQTLHSVISFKAKK